MDKFDDARENSVRSGFLSADTEASPLTISISLTISLDFNIVHHFDAQGHRSFVIIYYYLSFF